MVQSGLLRCFLFIALGTIGVWANEDVEGTSKLILQRAAQVPQEQDPFPRISFGYVPAQNGYKVKKETVERIPDSTRKRPREQAAPALRTPQPTPRPRKRQDDGQIQALSAQLRSLSESATRAISSVSSSASSAISLVTQSAQSVRQSADQAVQSANQNADQANRQLSQTQSSASSALSAASARASEDLARSLSSMSSRISSNLASVQSSASSVISAARVEASSSAANAVNIAASQIQAARAGASSVKGDANSIASQTQSNSISGTNVAIIVIVSVLGTAILTSVASYFIVRYRRKKKRDREGLATPIINEKQNEPPIAVRGTPGTPRFTPFGNGTGYPMDKLRLPDLSLSPFLRKKTNEGSLSDMGFGRSSYITNDGREPGSNDVYGISPTSFRLQKDNSVRSATSVRLIRIGSNKGKEKAKEEDRRALLSPILSPAPPPPIQTPMASLDPVIVSTPTQSQPFSPATPLSPADSQLSEPPPVATRSTRNSELGGPGISTIARSTTMSTQNRLRFRDSSDIESAESSPATWQFSTARAATATNPMRNTNTASLRPTTASSGGGDGNGSDQSPVRRPKNAGASFATFPRVREGPPRGSAAEAFMSGGRAGLNGVTTRLRDEAERRRREVSEVGGGDVPRSSRDGSTETRGPNWPFENTG